MNNNLYIFQKNTLTFIHNPWGAFGAILCKTVGIKGLSAPMQKAMQDFTANERF